MRIGTRLTVFKRVLSVSSFCYHLAPLPAELYALYMYEDWDWPQWPDGFEKTAASLRYDVASLPVSEVYHAMVTTTQYHFDYNFANASTAMILLSVI
jgi:hypothetical protein